MLVSAVQQVDQWCVCIYPLCFLGFPPHLGHQSLEWSPLCCSQFPLVIHSIHNIVYKSVRSPQSIPLLYRGCLDLRHTLRQSSYRERSHRNWGSGNCFSLELFWPTPWETPCIAGARCALVWRLQLANQRFLWVNLSLLPLRRSLRGGGRNECFRALKEASMVITESPAAPPAALLQALTTIAAEKNSCIIPLPHRYVAGYHGEKTVSRGADPELRWGPSQPLRPRRR